MKQHQLNSISKGGESINIDKARSVLLLIAIIIVVTLLAVSIIKPVNTFEGITALEGYEIAEMYSENGTLFHVQLPSVQIRDGLADGWKYSYGYYDNNGDITHNVAIYVFSNNTVLIRNSSGVGYPGGKITNWTIDSDEAYSIAMSDDRIKDFEGTLRYMNLDYFDDKLTWYISWGKSGFLDDPKWANIEIDATTGEVLYVDVDT